MVVLNEVNVERGIERGTIEYAGNMSLGAKLHFPVGPKIQQKKDFDQFCEPKIVASSFTSN